MLTCYFSAFCLCEVMVLKVNKHLRAGDRISYLPFREWSRTRGEYDSLYPRGILRQLTFTCVIGFLVLSVMLCLVSFLIYFQSG
jgi:hypothetical protein